MTKLECLAVLLAYKQFCPFLYGTHFTIVTDHSSLLWLQQMKDPEGRLDWWALKLQHYDFSIVHQAGAIHQNADGLSRLPPIAYLSLKEDCIYYLVGRPDLWPFENAAVQKRLKLMASRTQIKDGMLYKLFGTFWLPYVRPSFCTAAIMEGHIQIGHGAAKNIYEWL